MLTQVLIGSDARRATNHLHTQQHDERAEKLSHKAGLRAHQDVQSLLFTYSMVKGPLPRQSSVRQPWNPYPNT